MRKCLSIAIISQPLAWLTLMGILSSCAVSRVIQYDHLVGPLQYEGSHTIAIATLDKRQAVADGSRKPDFVGYMRSGMGVAWPIGTKSKMSLSEDFSSSISATLSSKGYKTKELKAEPRQSVEDVQARLVTYGGDRLLLVVMNTWMTDGYGDQALTYDLDIRVFDHQGKELASTSLRESKKPLGGITVLGPGNFKEYIPEAVKKEIAQLLSHEDIKAALE